MHKSGDIINGRFKVVEPNIHPHPKFLIHEVEDGQHANRPGWLKLCLEARVRYREQFEACNREVEILQRLTNRSIIHLLDHGWLPGGHFFMLVPKLDGQVLFFAVKQPDRPENMITVHKAVRLGLQLVDAVEEAFGAGILHRNLHPRGMYFCTQQQLLKVFDFGFAGMVDIVSAASPNASAATRAYRAPEVVRSVEQGDIRSEIYSVGAIIYYCLTGGSPFEEVAMTELEAAIFGKEPISIRTRRRDDAVPAELDRIVLRCMAKDPAHRYQTTDELYSVLDTAKRMLRGRDADERSRLAYPPPTDLRLDLLQRRALHHAAREFYDAGFDFTLDNELAQAQRASDELHRHDVRFAQRMSMLADRPDLLPHLKALLERLREMKIIP